MKRREFLSLSTGLAGLAISNHARGQSRPCPPGTLAAAGSGEVTTGCRGSDLPAWVPAPGTFADVSLNVPGDVAPLAGLHTRVQGPSAVFEVWTSGVYAPELGPMGSYVCWGGGHKAYDGNEVYRWDVATQLWSRMGNPSPFSQSSTPLDLIGAFPDGKPAAPHSYHTLGIRSAANGGGANGSLIQATLPAVADTGYGNMNSWWQFNFKTAIDAGANGTPGIGWSRFIDSSTIPQGNLGQKLMVQNPTTGDFWFFGGGNLQQGITRVSQTGVVTRTALGWNAGDYMAAGFVPGTGIVAILEGVTLVPTLNLVNTNTVVASPGTSVKTVSAAGVYGLGNGSLTWCPDRNSFACVMPDTPTIVRWLTPSNVSDPWSSTWAWTSETFTSAVGSSAHIGINGAHGRFVWVPAIKCFLWATGLVHKMQAYRPSGT